MVRRGVAYCVVALIGLGLTGCGMFRFDQREPWRLEAEEACLSQRLVQPSAYMSRSSAIDGPGACGITHPFRVTAFGGGAVGLDRRATLACPIIPRIDQWLTDTIQPAAALYLGSPVVEIRAGSYACRGRNNQRGARLSEHSFGNALDVSAFRLADGRTVTIQGGWRGREEEQGFLREVFLGACRHFTTVLGPGSDMFHYDHFHVDLARHDPAGRRRVCRPVIKFTPRVGPDAAASFGRPQRLPAPAAIRPSREEPPVLDEEDWEDAPRAGLGPPPASPARPALSAGAPVQIQRPLPPLAAPPLSLGAPRTSERFLPPANVGTGQIY